MRFLLFAVLATTPSQTDRSLIESLDECVQARFATPMPAALGMSRIVRPSSFGVHFTPLPNASRDFIPETAAEQKVVKGLESGHVQVGFYLAGEAESGPRSLKGPGVITRGTDRLAIPDLVALRTLGLKAQDGEFESTIGEWTVSARPVVASQERCLACHRGAKLHDRLGAAIYVYRRVEL